MTEEKLKEMRALFLTVGGAVVLKHIADKLNHKDIVESFTETNLDTDKTPQKQETEAIVVTEDVVAIPVVNELEKIVAIPVVDELEKFVAIPVVDKLENVVAIPVNNEVNVKVKSKKYKPCRYLQKDEAKIERDVWINMLTVDPSLFAQANDKRGCYNCKDPDHKLFECEEDRGTVCGRCGTQGVYHSICPFCYPHKFNIPVPSWYRGYVGYRPQITRQ